MGGADAKGGRSLLTVEGRKNPDSIMPAPCIGRTGVMGGLSSLLIVERRRRR